MNKKLIASLCCSLIASPLLAQQFNEYFEDNTLRIDYIFAGNSQQQYIFLDELVKIPGWAGRKNNLDKLPLAGNGQITVRDKESNKVIYKHSFSTLFQEWLNEEEATRLAKSFENPFLIPFPIKAVEVTLDLFNTHRTVMASYTHSIDPKDALIAYKGKKVNVSVEDLLINGTTEDCIDVVIVAEGYTEEEQEVFRKDAQIAIESIFSQKVFKENKQKFNIRAVGCKSDNSGVSIPQKGEWKNTVLSSHFDTFYSERYLTTLHLKDLHNVLAGIPYEHIIILANTNEYGGGGIYNSYTLTTAHHAAFQPVVAHEFGHSFGGLADEYFYDDEYVETYPKGIEPWEQNITTLAEFDSKWKSMVPADTPIPTPASNQGTDRYTKVGVYEGAGYCSKGVYRPVDECRMRVNDAPDFCPVCTEAIQKIINFYTK